MKLKNLYLSILTLICAFAANTATAQYASQYYAPVKNTDRSLFFSTASQGKKLPILWGLDTAWPDEWNMVRGVRYIGADNIGVARVSFQPWEWMLSTTQLTPTLEANLVDRLRLVSYIGGPGQVKLILNNDAPGDKYDRRYSHAAADPNACRAYCNLIYGTLLSCQKKGWEVITASPLNEPDYEWNEQGSKDDFLAIAKMLKTEYDQFKDGSIRISGGNTLNCDQADPWYSYLYDYIDEGNTHQLAGDFDHYADFFAKVRADGKYATADELHNVMEAMVGVEYGMQTGIWWGTAELARGEFCKASFGDRLAYAENRKAWSSAAVYRAPDGKIQAFVGSSERQANVCSFRFVSQDRDVFYNGHGPLREYVVDIPGGDGYQLPTQTSAECVVDITWGEDVSPVIDGNYQIMNKKSRKLLAVKGAPGNSSPVKQYSTAQASVKLWEVKPAPNTIGGDFSYHTIKIADKTNFKLDVNNWSLNEGGDIIIYDGSLGTNEQWYLKYAGDGYFRIFSRFSNLCLQLAEAKDGDGVAIVQAAPSESPTQLWRFIAPNVMCETVAPEAPTELAATPQHTSITLSWTKSTSSDVEQYVVLRADGGSDEFNTIARNITTTQFVDNTVKPGKSYTYKVKAIDKACNSSAFSATVEAETVGEPQLIARYLFNKNLEDATDNHFDGAIVRDSKVTYTSKDDNTQALRLNYKRFVQLPYMVANHPEITVGAWINPQIDGENQTIFDFGADTEHYASLCITPANELEFTLSDGDQMESVKGGKLKTKEWQHVVVTLSKERATIYIDGQQVATTRLTLGRDLADIAPVTNYLGCNQGRTDAFLNALIADLCIYDFVVDESKVAAMMEGVVGIIDTITDAALVETQYYNMLGVRVNEPQHGVYIVKRVYDNGKVVSTKEILR